VYPQRGHSGPRRDGPGQASLLRTLLRRREGVPWIWPGLRAPPPLGPGLALPTSAAGPLPQTKERLRQGWQVQVRGLELPDPRFAPPARRLGPPRRDTRDLPPLPQAHSTGGVAQKGKKLQAVHRHVLRVGRKSPYWAQEMTYLKTEKCCAD
jgi:hypothetical protein